MARSKAQQTHAKRAREMARLEKRARKHEKKEARKLAASDDPTPESQPSDRPHNHNPREGVEAGEQGRLVEPTLPVRVAPDR